MAGFFRQFYSFILPVTAVLVVPFFLVGRVNPFTLHVNQPLPFLQLPLSILIFLGGLSLLVATIRLFIEVGLGTLAPWDPTRRLVVAGPYRYVRNPMIAGVLFMLLGETVFFGSPSLLAWLIIFWFVNNVYFKLSEEPGLIKRFGKDYVTYRAHVPMWIPRFKAWQPDLDNKIE